MFQSYSNLLVCFEWPGNVPDPEGVKKFQFGAPNLTRVAYDNQSYNMTYPTAPLTRQPKATSFCYSVYSYSIIDGLHRKIRTGRSVQSYFLNSVTHITMLRTSFVKTNTLHRVTTKTPNLLRRWGHSIIEDLHIY